MILGVGMDLVAVERVARMLAEHGVRFEERVFGPAERADSAGRSEALAARFAAKEACLKALGTGWREGLAPCQIEVVRGPGGRPALHLSGAAAQRAAALRVRALHVSLSRQPGLAGAVVILEG
jgi:holo-[acyl-carrier protein] synthase